MKQQYISQLRQERERRGWSRNYVAEQVEVDVVTVGRWERGERLPHPVYRQKLCTLFEMNAEDLGLLPDLSEKPGKDASGTITLSSSRESESAVPHASAGLDAPHAIEAVNDPSTDTLIEKDRPVPASLAGRPTRRSALIGLGGLGLAALLGGTGFLLARRPSHPAAAASRPVHILAGRPFQQFWDPNTTNWINRLSWSPDGLSLAAATGTNLVSIWSRAEGEITRYCQTPNVWVDDVSWATTGWIAMASAESHAGSLEVWKLTENQAAITIKRPYALRSTSWSPDGGFLAFSGHSPLVEVWNPFLARQISQYLYPALSAQEGISRVRWSPAGGLLACGTDDGTVHVWEALTGQARYIYHKHQDRVIDIVWSPDGRYIASASADKTAHVWEALSGRTVCLYQGHTDQVEAIDWSLQGKYIVSGGKDQTAQVWEALTGKLYMSYEQLGCVVETALWSRDGTMVVLGTDAKGIEIWKLP